MWLNVKISGKIEIIENEKIYQYGESSRIQSMYIKNNGKWTEVISKDVTEEDSLAKVRSDFLKYRNSSQGPGQY